MSVRVDRARSGCLLRPLVGRSSDSVLALVRLPRSATQRDPEQLAQAATIGCDFVTFSPLRITPSHPDAAPVGWHDFQQLVETAAMPVFALGGVTRGDIDQARAVGAQGIASIRDLWK